MARLNIQRGLQPNRIPVSVQAMNDFSPGAIKLFLSCPKGASYRHVFVR
jgi:hypothetical protein